MKPSNEGAVRSADSEPDRTLRATERKLGFIARIMLQLFARSWPCRAMDTRTTNAREALFREVAAGHIPNPERLAVLARLLGVTVQAALLDLLVEAKGLA